MLDLHYPNSNFQINRLSLTDTTEKLSYCNSMTGRLSQNKMNLFYCRAFLHPYFLSVDCYCRDVLFKKLNNTNFLVCCVKPMSNTD